MASPTETTMTSSLRLAILHLILFAFHEGSAVCYFPVELHGTFLMQTQATAAYGGSVVSYSEITVEVDAIPPWGRCHRRRGHHVILKDSTGTEDCMRCFHLTLKTPNVIQIHAEGLARCYTNEEAARATCPDDRAVSERRFTEIILYRKHQEEHLKAGRNGLVLGSEAMPGVTGGTVSVGLHQMFCPINGRYRFQYSANGEEFRCAEPYSSELSNCPRGDGLTVRFRQCSFPDFDVSFLCLGDWESGRGGDRYLALMDLRRDPESRPRYRCGLYREEPGTGRVYVALSSDSTCTTQLTSATSGYESLILTPVPERSLPAEVESATCRYPEWSQGQWERVRVEAGTLVFRDTERFVTLTARCVARQNSTPNDRLVVYGVTQCGEELYYCLWLRRRSLNVMEFQLGSNPSAHFSEALCGDDQFATTTWVTQGRSQSSLAACPITGDYTGVIPGTTGLCARVASDCNNPDIMFYSVSSCDNKTHVYEEREYRCLGSWEEDGVTYTYTQRRDIPGYQCFSGKIIRSGDEAYIKEAGESCIRGEDPLLYGMKIAKQASCNTVLPPRPPPVRAPSLPPRKIGGRPLVPPLHPNTHDPYWYRAETQHPSTKTWKAVTGRPRLNEIPGSGAGISGGSHITIAASWMTILLFLALSAAGTR